jgi:dTDP-4-dehydrorhamnose 3,5-epimerase
LSTVRVIPTALPEVCVIEPVVHRDQRGFFLETFHATRYREAGIAEAFVQDNHSRSGPRTLRGLHGQFERPQGKLVRCVRGAIFDVAVDARCGSPTFAKWTSATLSAEDCRQLWVPPGFLHGFCVLSDDVEVEYKCTAFYEAALDFSVRWDDPDLAITWPISDPVLSPKDAAAPRFAAVMGRLPRYRER